MAYCDNCGTNLNRNSNFCPNCGASINNYNTSSGAGIGKTVAGIAGAAIGLSILGNLGRHRRHAPPPPPPSPFGHTRHISRMPIHHHGHFPIGGHRPPMGGRPMGGGPRTPMGGRRPR